MPRLTGPLFSLDARQTLAKTIVYSAWKGINYARIRVIPYNPKSAAQQGVRTSLTYGVQYWRDGSVVAGDKTAWNGYAAGLNESGFNRYMRYFIQDNYDEGTQSFVFVGIPAPR